MADSTIPNLVAVTTPVSTDLFRVRQAADTRDKKMTRAQLHTLQSGEHLVLPQVNEPATPTLGLGDGDSGFYEESDDVIGVATLGAKRYQFSGSEFRTALSAGPAIVRENASDTNPTIIPNFSDLLTGVGHRTTSIGVLVAKSVNCLEFGGVGDVPQLGFYGTAAISKQTGVAVTDAGIHAALVALGLIAA